MLKGAEQLQATQEWVAMPSSLVCGSEVPNMIK